MAKERYLCLGGGVSLSDGHPSGSALNKPSEDKTILVTTSEEETLDKVSFAPLDTRRKTCIVLLKVCEASDKTTYSLIHTKHS